jgi:hypothetical protein
MLPITYSASEVFNGIDGRGSSYQKLNKSKQVKPYDQPAAYERIQGYTLSAIKATPLSSFGQMANAQALKGPWQLAWGRDVSSHFSTELSSVLNSTYEKFRDKAKDTADMATNIAERQQSLDMIERRALHLLSAVKALKRGDFRRVAALLGVQRPKSVKTAAKSFGDLWLEFHFGWDPMLQDIGNAVEILQSPIADKAVRARGKRYNIKVDYNNHTSTLWQRGTVRGSIRASASAIVNVTNPNLYRANELGFINPASVAWELVPFSFVVDWFVPVGAFLNSFTDWVGIQLDRASYFYIVETPEWLGFYRDRPSPIGPYTVGYDISTYGIHAKRVLGVPGVTLVPRRWSGLSPTRAATAISLLLQGLRSV